MQINFETDDLTLKIDGETIDVANLGLTQTVTDGESSSDASSWDCPWCGSGLNTGGYCENPMCSWTPYQNDYSFEIQGSWNYSTTCPHCKQTIYWPHGKFCPLCQKPLEKPDEVFEEHIFYYLESLTDERFEKPHVVQVNHDGEGRTGVWWT